MDDASFWVLCVRCAKRGCLRDESVCCVHVSAVSALVAICGFDWMMANRAVSVPYVASPRARALIALSLTFLSLRP